MAASSHTGSSGQGRTAWAGDGGPKRADVGLIGLAVMGQNLALNIADHGRLVAVYNRTTAVTEAFVAENPPGVFGKLGGGLLPAKELKDFVASIARPRRIIIMVKAGGPTDAVIDSLVPLLEKGDVIVDGGNAEWTDTVRREKALTDRGLLFVGSGVSGGEEGARFGPSLMPGGRPEAWALLEPIWREIAAKVDAKTGRPIPGAARGKPVDGGVACTAYIGPGGSGHYVKMVHNGIEYGDMQLICEAYHFLREVLKLTPDRLSAIFQEWNQGDLDSFLVEITADILRQKDPATGKPFVDVVLDAAGQKGTGKWTIASSLDLGVPAPTMAEAVFARNMSAMKSEREAAATRFSSPLPPLGLDASSWLIGAVKETLYCSKICSYAQGFALMREASRVNAWNLKLGEIASIFRGGCIIRARFLQKITEAYQRDAELPNLLLDAYFSEVIEKGHHSWRKVVSLGALLGIPTPGFSSALAYLDSYRCARLPASLLQAQRDYFGAHTYERVDRPRGQFFHLDWTDPARPERPV